MPIPASANFVFSVASATPPLASQLAGAIEAGIANSRRVVITDAGHLVYLEKPEEFSRVVITFIDRDGP